MASKTYNRRPFVVDTPSSSDVKEYFFNHFNWKGLSNDENFSTVDQETFSRCDNVYVNTEGLLRSRPSLKMLTLVEGDYRLSNVDDFWQFDDMKVYKTHQEEHHFLTFVNGETVMQCDCQPEVRIVYSERKVFVFSPVSIHCYDVDKNEYLSAEEYVYVPVTSTLYNGVRTELESENELTSAYYTRYIFDDTKSVLYNTFVDKNVKVNLDNEIYEIKFVKNNNLVFVSKLNTLSKSNVTSNIYTYGDIILLSVSEVGNMILSEVDDEGQYTIFYSVDGYLFDVLPELEDIVGIPAISYDGSYAMCMKADDLYAYPLVDVSDDLPQSWTGLLKHNNSAKYSEYLSQGLKFTDVCNFYAISYDTFCITAFLNSVQLVCIVAYQQDLYKYDIMSPVPTYPSAQLTDYIVLINNFEMETEIPIISASSLTYAYSDNIYVLQKFTNVRYFYGVKFELSDLPQDYIIYDVEYSLYVNDKLYSSKLKLTDVLCPSYAKVENLSWTVNYRGSVPISVSFTSDSLYLDPGYGGKQLYRPLHRFMHTLHMNAQLDDFQVAINDGEISYIKGVNSERAWYYDVSDAHTSLNGLHISPKQLQYTKRDGNNVKLIRYVFNDTEQTIELGAFDSKDSFIIQAETILTNACLIHVYSDDNVNKIPLLFKAKPVALINNNMYLIDDSYNLYSNVTGTKIYVDELTEGNVNYFLPSHVSELSNWYFSKDKTLYISSYVTGTFKWYFPKINTEEIDYNITNLHPISSTDMAVFTKDFVYYIQSSELGYLYYKSKIQVSCREGADVITTLDGKYIIFPSVQGLVAMTYQELVASTEQVLTYLSDSIFDVFTNFNTQPVKLCKYKHWIICYNGSTSILVFDIRNNSWWPMSSPCKLEKLSIMDDKLNILSLGSFYNLHDGDEEYYDYDGENKMPIDWFVESQKLHFNAINYYKHISNISLTSVLQGDGNMDLNLTVTNYRKKSNTSETENFDFEVQAIRTYVKRLNYSKVNEFSYTLSSSDSYVQIPLSLSSISIKYKISGQVR